jgi:hypothetical protein
VQGKVAPALSALDPVQLLNQIRHAQRSLADLEVGSGSEKGAQANQELSRFVASLSTAWRTSEVRPTHRKRSNWAASLAHSLGSIRNGLASREAMAR